VQEILQRLQEVHWPVFVSLAAPLAALLLHMLVFIVLRGMASRTTNVVDDLVVKHWNAPTRLFVVFAASFLSFAHPAVPASARAFAYHGLTLGVIFCVAWLLSRTVRIAHESVLARHDVTVADNLAARKVHTQLGVIVRMLNVVIGILGFGAMLMTFDGIRQLGTAVLASAGIAGVVVGFAAKKSLATLVAGLQIALTQPIRLDDVVIVEGEWGRIEEITLTYVVVRIWDLRRLVLPVTYFIERPFQNWTRVTADILGPVFIHADYNVPIGELRKELQRIVEKSDKWDRKVCGLVVTNATDRTLELRALVSAADASKAWDLRCEVREGLVKFLQENHPESLPKVRVETGSAGDADGREEG
jgi:small-conductance mechanosensitive channel